MDNKTQNEFKKLIDIILQLRRECPWDKEQTMNTLIQHSIEEIYELADAIYNNDMSNIKEELGDIVMHIIFYSLIAEEKNNFNLFDILENINKKLVFRHPHIFKDNMPLKTSKEVLENWQIMKKKEGKVFTLQGISKNLPSITKAIRIQEKASQSNFDFKNKENAFDKINEEISELRNNILNNYNIEDEFGDVLFSLINYARFLNIDPEFALQKTNQKFIDRFTLMEKISNDENKNFKNLSLEEKEILWLKAKENIK